MTIAIKKNVLFSVKKKNKKISVKSLDFSNDLALRSLVHVPNAIAQNLTLTSIETYGAGSYASVLKGKLRPNQMVAIKIEPTPENEIFPRRLQYVYKDEITALIALNAIGSKSIVESWSIPKVHLFGQFLQYNYFVMPWLERNIFRELRYQRKKDIPFKHETVLPIILHAVILIS